MMSSTYRFLIHVHVFYLQQWRQLSNCIATFPPGSYKLVVTSPFPEVEKLVRASFPKAQFEMVENKGYDVLPFLRMLQKEDLSHYDYVVKLHTKRDLWGWTNHAPMVAGLWRRYLFRFCSSWRKLNKTLKLFENDSSVGMVSGHYLLIENEEQDDEQKPIHDKAREILLRDGLRTITPLFVAGSMFIARSAIMSRLVRCVRDSDFDEEQLPQAHHSTIYHVYERVLGYIVEALGYRIVDIDGIITHCKLRTEVREWFFAKSQWVYRATLKPLVVAVGLQD